MTRKLQRRMALSRQLLNHRRAPPPRDPHAQAVQREAEMDRALRADDLEAVVTEVARLRHVTPVVACRICRNRVELLPTAHPDRWQWECVECGSSGILDVAP